MGPSVLPSFVFCLSKGTSTCGCRGRIVVPFNLLFPPSAAAPYNLFGYVGLLSNFVSTPQIEDLICSSNQEGSCSVRQNCRNLDLPSKRKCGRGQLYLPTPFRNAQLETGLGHGAGAYREEGGAKKDDLTIAKRRRGGACLYRVYRVTYHFDSNLPLTS